VVALLCLLLLLAPLPVAASDDDHSEEDEGPITEQILIELVPGADIAAVAARYNVTVLEGISELRLWRVRVALGVDPEVVAEAMEDDAEIASAEEHDELSIPEGVQRSVPDLGIIVDLNRYLSQWGAVTIRAGAAHQLQTGQGVTVAVLDTGIASAHPQLGGMVSAQGRDFVIGGNGTTEPQPNGVDDDGDGLVDEALYHGTFVAGLIRLAAPDTRILPVRVLDADGIGTTWGIAEGILYAVRQGADVVNLSVRLTRQSDLIAYVIRMVTAQGVVVVAAAGNDGLEHIDYPAALPDVIAVAAVDADLSRAAFSNFGSEVDVSAPGVALLSTYGEATFAGWEGTSFAAPLVSAAAAMILEKYPGLTPDQVRRLLRETALRPDGWNSETMGEGVIDLAALSRAVTRDRSSLKLALLAEGTELHWSAVQDATRYDLVRGDLAELTADFEGRTVLGTVSCLLDDQTPRAGLRLVDPELPAPGRAYFYLFRDNAPDADGYALPDGPQRTVAGLDCSGG